MWPVVDELAAVLGDLPVGERAAQRPAAAADAVGGLVQLDAVAGLAQAVGAGQPGEPRPTTTILGPPEARAEPASLPSAVRPNAATPASLTKIRRVVRRESASAAAAASCTARASGVRAMGGTMDRPGRTGLGSDAQNRWLEASK